MINSAQEIAIVMAAGKGERMYPLTLNTPKPLVQVFGVPMIETVLAGLEQRGVGHIYVVVGYLKEQFVYLLDKYPNLTLLENSEYEFKNNISSIYAAREIMGRANCFVCEADLYVSAPEIFQADLRRSCYFGKKIAGHSDDWVNMAGVSYFPQADAAKIAQEVAVAYQQPGHEQLYWDEVVDKLLHMGEMRLGVHAVPRQSIVEIDSVAELQEFMKCLSEKAE